MIRRADTDQRQLELADVALQIIATRGITALTTRAVAELVGLTSGAIFKHFALLEAVVVASKPSSTRRFPATTRRAHKTRAFIVSTLKAGQDAGEVRVDLSAEALAPIVMGTIQMLALSRPRNGDGGATREALLNLLSTQLVSTKHRKAP